MKCDCHYLVSWLAGFVLVAVVALEALVIAASDFRGCHEMRSDTKAADDAPLRVELDVSEVPHLSQWGEEAKAIILEWHPRICSLLPTEGVKPAREITLKLQKSDHGIAGTSGTTITVSSHWIEKHPDDLGLVFHELVHVIQAYPSGKPWWLTEGIADYLRWGIYEGKEPKWFSRPKEPEGYKKGYQVAAGFLLWLESEISPGIVEKLNTAMRRGEYSEDLFKTETERSINELWDNYVVINP